MGYCLRCVRLGEDCAGLSRLPALGERPSLLVEQHQCYAGGGAADPGQGLGVAQGSTSRQSWRARCLCSGQECESEDGCCRYGLRGG